MPGSLITMPAYFNIPLIKLLCSDTSNKKFWEDPLLNKYWPREPTVNPHLGVGGLIKQFILKKSGSGSTLKFELEPVEFSGLIEVAKGYLDVGEVSLDLVILL